MKERFSRLTLGLCLVALALCVSCRGPVLMDGGRTDLSLSFLVNAVGKDADGASRLLLPTANRLVVELAPQSGETLTRELSIGAGQNTVKLSFPDLPFGQYGLDVTAYFNLEARYQKSIQLALISGQNSFAVNLVPVGSGLTSLPFSSFGHIKSDLSPGQASSHIVPVSLVSSGALDCFLNGDPELLIFVQRSDGSPINDDPATHRVQASVPADEQCYITVYNPSALDKSYILEVNLPFTVSPTGIAMVNVPGGRFQRDATSATNVSVVGPFSISKYEITQAQWQAVASDTYPSGFLNGDYPAYGMDYYDIAAFCNRLSIAEGLTPVYTIWTNIETVPPQPWDGTSFPVNQTTYGKIEVNFSADGYRLPTEMEWLWAAMGAPVEGQGGGIDTEAFANPVAGSFNSAVITDFAWTSGSLERGGQKRPNELGLYDMSGNVWEWCYDGQNALPSDVLMAYRRDPPGYGSVVLKGGAYNSGGAGIAIADRASGATTDEFASRGIRLVRGIVPANRLVLASYVNGSTGGVLGYFIDPETDQPISGFLGNVRNNVLAYAPAGLAVHPSGRWAYAGDQYGNIIRRYTINRGSGALEGEMAVDNAYGATTKLVMDSEGKYLFALANMGSDAVISFAINPGDGSLTKVSQVSVGQSCVGLALDPSGKHIYVTSSSDSSYYVITVDRADGTLSGSTPVTTGNSPMETIVHPSGMFVYFPFSLATAMAYNARDTLTGALTAGSANINPRTHLYLAIQPAGNYLYASGVGGLFGYALSPSTGEPTVLNGGASYVSGGNRMLFDPEGRYLFVLGYDGNTLTQLRIDSGTGALNVVGAPIAGSTGMDGGFLAITDTP